MFTHLHLHTVNSLLDGLVKIKPLVAKLKELGMTACAMTDHGVMYGLYDFWSECKANDIKPIIGCEVYVAPRSRFDKDKLLDKKRYHLTLLAQNEIGYHNLMKICSAGHLDGYYTKPRVDREILAKYSEGIIATTGCAASPVNRNLIRGNIELAYAWAEFFKEIYPGRFFVEIQRNGIKECEDAIPAMLKLGQDLNLKPVATCDVHYLNKEDADLQEVNWCIRDATLLDDPNRAKKWSDEFYVKSHAEMMELFKDIPEAVENTQMIADMCDKYSIKYDRVQPSYAKYLKPSYTAKEQLRELTFEGLKNRYNLERLDDENHLVEIKNPYKDLSQTIKELKDRLDYELKVIDDKGYNDYFLVVGDFLNWSKRNQIMAGVRGSVGGSLVSYCLGISDIDPIRWELYFERFLNPERPSPPDIDSDLQADKRHLVINYIKEKYGEDNCCLILALGKLTTRAGIRDVCRTMGIPLMTADKLSKMVTIKFGKVTKMKDMMKVDEFKKEIEKDPKLMKMVEYVGKIEDMPRQTGTHACGMLITPAPVAEYVPLQYDKEDRITCQLEMKPLEEMGLMKFDLLGLETLGALSACLNLIKKYHNINIDILHIPQDDDETFKLFQRGDTDAIFQFESEGMKQYFKILHPTTIDDLCFMAAAYRPGPMQYITPYIKRKQGKEDVDYLLPEMEHIVKDTYGFAIYQEQVIRIAVDIAGYTMGEADMLRRAMGKKVKEIMDKEGVKFIEKCIVKGYSEEIANKLFDYLKPFADYGFNKSHSAGYAFLAYQTGYLKAHYPIEFIAGVMQIDLENPEKLKRDITMAQKNHIQVLPPRVNESELLFTIEETGDGKNAIRFGLGGIKNSSKKLAELIVDERLKNGKYMNLDELVSRVGIDNCTKSNMELLVKVGVFDEFGNRSQLLKVLPVILERFKLLARPKLQDDMFSIIENGETESNVVDKTPLPILEDLSDKEKIAAENEHLGTFFTTHPIIQYKNLIDHKKLTDIDHIQIQLDGTKVRLIAISKKYKKILTKKDQKPMAFATIEDLTGEIEIVIFNKTYEKYFSSESTEEIHSKLESGLKDGELWIFEGKVTNRDDKQSIMIDEIYEVNEDKIPKLNTLLLKERANPLNDSDEEFVSPEYPSEILDNPTEVTLDISKEKDTGLLSNLKSLLLNNKGYIKVNLKMEGTNGVIVKQLKDGIDTNLLSHDMIKSYII